MGSNQSTGGQIRLMDVISLIDQEAQFHKDHEHLSREQMLAMAMAEEEDYGPPLGFSYSKAELIRRSLERAERMRGCTISPTPSKFFPDDEVRKIKLVNNGNVLLKAGDWLVAYAPTRDEVSHSTPSVEPTSYSEDQSGYDYYRSLFPLPDAVSYETARAGQRRERQLLQEEPIIIPDKRRHASTIYKQTTQMKQKNRIVHTRSNTQKRQLYGAPIKGKK